MPSGRHAGVEVIRAEVTLRGETEVTQCSTRTRTSHLDGKETEHTKGDMISFRLFCNFSFCACTKRHVNLDLAFYSDDRPQNLTESPTVGTACDGDMEVCP